MLARSQSVGAFVKKVWELVGGGKQLGIAYDQVLGASSYPLLRERPSHEIFIARVSISPLHFHLDPLRCLSRHIPVT